MEGSIMGELLHMDKSPFFLLISFRKMALLPNIQLPVNLSKME
jgi:hypothetical protein